jgi:hypothetical protein
MAKSKVISISQTSISFDDGTILSSDHKNDCCEDHYLYFNDLNLDDFDDLEFDLSSDSFFERVPDYGIKLLPLNGHPISIPGYADNNGYYSDNLALVLSGTIENRFDITECQSEHSY